MSFDFNSNSINNQFKAQSAYKDASGMGGGGMYFRQKKKDEDEEDVFQSSQDANDEISLFGDEKGDKDIPEDTLFNKFVNWFNIKKDKN